MPDEILQTPQPEAAETPEQKYARLYAVAAQQVQQQTPIVAQMSPEVAQTLSELRSELAALKEGQKPVEPVTSAAWVDKIRQGDFEGAERVLTAKVQEAMGPTLDAVRQKAYQEAVSASQANLEIDRHIQQVRLQNPDIVQFEKYLTPLVNQRVEEAKTAGKIKSHQDFVREYKSAVDSEVTELRNLGLVLRGQGKTEGQTRNQQILASSVLQPNQVQSTQVASPEQQTPDVSVESYFARRRADEERRRGLGV